MVKKARYDILEESKSEEEKLEYAKGLDKVARGAERKADEGSKSYTEAAELFEQAGDTWVKMGNVDRALIDYEFAKKHSKENPNVLARIDKKVRRAVYSIGGLERILPGVVSIIFLAAALFFVSLKLTGDSIGGLEGDKSAIAGVILFAFGLVFAFVYFRKKKTLKR